MLACMTGSYGWRWHGPDSKPDQWGSIRAVECLNRLSHPATLSSLHRCVCVQYACKIISYCVCSRKLRELLDFRWAWPARPGEMCRIFRSCPSVKLKPRNPAGVLRPAYLPEPSGTGRDETGRDGGVPAGERRRGDPVCVCVCFHSRGSSYLSGGDGRNVDSFEELCDHRGKSEFFV